MRRPAHPKTHSFEVSEGIYWQRRRAAPPPSSEIAAQSLWPPPPLREGGDTFYALSARLRRPTFSAETTL